MIDLHIHTIASEGKMSVYRLLETIKEANLDYFSIVDVNHALAYRLIDKDEFPNLITGVKFRTIYNDRIIELLAYDIDTEKVNQWYDEIYPLERLEIIEGSKSTQLLEKLKEDGYEIKVEDLRYDRLAVSYHEIFKTLISEYPEFPYDNARDFLIYEIRREDSPYFIDFSDVYLDIDEIIKLVKDVGGKVFLAHPFEYRRDIADLLEMVVSKNLDGVEVFHASASVVNSLKLIEFCKVTNKLASIGSGFIGDEEMIPLGVVVDEEILKLDCFKWIYDRGEKNE